jgi:hypothetical protein
LVVQTFAGLIKKGLASERPTHAAYLTDFLYYATDTGDLWYDNGSAWVQLQGATKAEILQNKILLSTNNTLSGILQDPFTSQRREGWIVPGISAAASLKHVLSGIASTGTYSYFYDTTEGYVSRFSASSVSKIGYASDTASVISRREWATRLKIRMRATTTGSTNIYAGFTNQGTSVISSNASPFLTSEMGIFVGFNSQNNFFSSYRNDGAGGAATVTSFGVTKDTNFHTFEMIMSDTNIVCTLDGANTQTHTTQIPTNTTDLKLAIQCHALDTVSRSFDIAKASFSSDLT